MISARAKVVAVSDCGQERETLVIMLDPDFDVTAIASPEGPVAQPPAAVVWAGRRAPEEGVPALWPEAEMREMLARWPAAGWVFVDAPAALVSHFPDAALASWTDPFSVPAAVKRIVRYPTARPPAGAMARALHAADAALRPDLESAQALAALVDTTRRAESTEMALRFLGERIAALLDRLAWVEWFDLDADLSSGATEPQDLHELLDALHLALEERSLRAQCRDLDFAWSRGDEASASPVAARALVLARCLRQILFSLPAGRVSIEVDARRLSCRHAELPARAVETFDAIALQSLLHRVHLQLSLAEAELTVCPEPTYDRLGA